MYPRNTCVSSFAARLRGLALWALSLTIALVPNRSDARVIVDSFTLSVSAIHAPPEIIQQPASAGSLPGKRVSFGVVAESSAVAIPLTYQWYFNDQPIQGAAARKATYTFTASAARAGHYHVVVSDDLSTSSELVELVVYAKPKFTTQPASLTLDAGQPLTLSAPATGVPAPSYQWFYNGVEIPDATSATYHVDAVDALDTGVYKVRATNAVGAAFSRVASVVVRSEPLIVDSPADTDAFVGTPLRLSVTAHGFPKRSYRWRFNGEPICGATASVFVLKPALAKTGVYDVVVTNALGSDVSEPFTVTVHAAPKLIVAPVGAKKRVGQSHLFQVEAPAYPSPTYQWIKDGVELDGQTLSTLALSPLSLTDGGLYSVRVSNSLGTFTTKPVKLSVSLAPFGPVKGSAYRFDTTVYSIFGDTIQLNAKFTLAGGKMIVTDYTDNTVSSEKLDFTRLADNRVRMRFYTTEDGVRITMSMNFYFSTPTSGTLVTSVYADGYGVIGSGSDPFTYTEPGL